ncbi:unnamed protein product [Adineta ricciae]|uniref:G-protein coupled receptors family 1 profile domain-containing protein n=1 Tax=Adineta ricciae TaxID=249248 RepID=A0A814F664_ADIRI|nr:unnamed protein product [Adineta ricciae]CAF1415826.1 unnamed protein product [Adineta ricciae]
MSNITVITTTFGTVDDQIRLTILFNVLIKTFSQCLDGFAWIIGNIGAICTCIVFHQAIFRKSPCAMYVTASNFSQLFIFNFATFIRMIQYGYGVLINSLPAWFCRIRFYIYYVSMANARYNIIFASADRYFSSSQSINLRQWSSSKVALRLIIIDAIIWILFYIQVLVMYDVQSNKCRIHSTSFFTYFNYFITFENGLLPIIPMSIFGLLTIRNIHQSKRRIRTTESINGSENGNITLVLRKETQLHKMLINQVIVYLIFNIPLPVYGIYRSYISISTLSRWRAVMDTFMNNLFYDMIYLGYALTFPIFILTSDIFRRELKKIIKKKLVYPCQRIITRTN